MIRASIWYLFMGQIGRPCPLALSPPALWHANIEKLRLQASLLPLFSMQHWKSSWYEGTGQALSSLALQHANIEKLGMDLGDKR